jgi:hypothetical protein
MQVYLIEPRDLRHYKGVFGIALDNSSSFPVDAL